MLIMSYWLTCAVLLLDNVRSKLDNAASTIK